MMQPIPMPVLDGITLLVLAAGFITAAWAARKDLR